MKRFGSLTKVLIVIVFVIFACLLAGAKPASIGEWPQWRGSNRDGVSTESGLLKEWPADGPKLAWQAKGIGKGMGSVAIHAGKIFVLGQRKDGQFIIAYELATQRELWATRVSASGDEPTGTPTVDGGQVFAEVGGFNGVQVSARNR